MRTIYKNDFVRKPSKINKHKHQLSEMYITPALNAGYLDLNTTYHKDFVNKMGLITKIKPQDNLKNRSNSLQAVTTYMRSYQSTITPKPDDVIFILFSLSRDYKCQSGQILFHFRQSLSIRRHTKETIFQGLTFHLSTSRLWGNQNQQEPSNPQIRSVILL